MPGPVFRGGAASAFVAVTLFTLHVGGWDLAAHGAAQLWFGTYLVGLPVAATVVFYGVAPVLRRRAAAGPLVRARTIRLGAVVFGGIVLVWMVALGVGPPGRLLLWAEAAGLPLAVVGGVYSWVLTPAVFAVYGALAAWVGWRIAFGRAAEADLGDHLRLP
ncbi:MAG: hypothetical protein ACFBSD_16820 [Paracoccaceae bacterium]